MFIINFFLQTDRSVVRDAFCIPQGTTFVNNRGPDRLPGPKTLDPYHSRQPILLSGRPNCACFVLLMSRTSDIAAIGIGFGRE